MVSIETVRSAAVVAAAELSARPEMTAPFLERDLRDRLATALGGETEKTIRIDGWSRTLGGVDVFVPGTMAVGLEPELPAGIETKMWATDQVLYDMLKLAAMCQQGDLGIGYVVVAARHHDWIADAARGGVISKMTDEALGAAIWSTVDAIEYEGTRWRKMVEKTNVKPVWVPARIGTTTTAAVEVPAIVDHEIRIISVGHIGDGRLRLDEHGSIVDM